MNTAVINIKTEPEVKEKAKKVAEELGFNLTAVLNGYLRQLVRTKRINFSLEEPSERLINAMKKAKKDRLKGIGSPIFTDDKALIAKDSKKYIHSSKMQEWLSEQGV